MIRKLGHGSWKVTLQVMNKMKILPGGGKSQMDIGCRSFATQGRFRTHGTLLLPHVKRVNLLIDIPRLLIVLLPSSSTQTSASERVRVKSIEKQEEMKLRLMMKIMMKGNVG